MWWGTVMATLKCAVLSHNTMPQMSQVLKECAIGMLTAGMSTRAVASEFNVHLSTRCRLQRRFTEFGSTSNRPHNRRPLIWHHVGEQFANSLSTVVNKVPHGGVMVCAGISYGQRTQMHLNAQKYSDEIVRPMGGAHLF